MTATGHEIWSRLQKPGKKPPAEPKRIATKGRRQLEYEQWRDETAIPYLDENFGHVCAWPGCTRTMRLTVDHIQKRGSHVELKMELSNVQWLCSHHHSEKDGGMRVV